MQYCTKLQVKFAFIFTVVTNNTDCRCCKVDRPLTDGLNTDLHLDISTEVSLEKVDKFCYLGDILDADGGCDLEVTARVRSAWKKFHEYLPILTGKGFSLKLKGRVYATCVQGSHASWKVLDFFLENSRTCKVLENYFGPGKSWKLKLKVLESPGKISLKVMHFSSGSNGKQAAIV